jgi:hypothetical protein
VAKRGKHYIWPSLVNQAKDFWERLANTKATKINKIHIFGDELPVDIMPGIHDRQREAELAPIKVL